MQTIPVVHILEPTPFLVQRSHTPSIGDEGGSAGAVDTTGATLFIGQSFTLAVERFAGRA